MSKKEKNKSEVSSHNIIALGTKLEGTISLESDIRIEGEINGNINASSKVIVGQTGVVTGNIVCDNIDIMGTVVGDIFADSLLSLKSTANVRGNLNTSVLAIAPNALFEGTCKTINNTQQPSSQINYYGCTNRAFVERGFASGVR